MDQAITLKYQSIKQVRNKDIPALQRVWFYEPIIPDQRNHRGTLILVVELNNKANADIDLEKLAESIYSKAQDEYYHNHNAGSPMESLETTIQIAKEHGEQLSQNRANIKIGAVGLWGKSLIYANSFLLPIGVRRANEFYEFDQPPIGTELIRDDDLLIVSSAAFFEQQIKPNLREQQELPNTEFLSLYPDDATEEPQPESQNIAIFGHIKINQVPGDEEIIEIHYPEEFKVKKPSPITSLTVAGKGVGTKLMKMLPKKLAKPNIYIKKTATTKKKKLLALSGISLLLLSSISVTHVLRKNKESAVNYDTVFSQVSGNLERASQLASLNPNEALSLIQSSKDELGSVAGMKEEDSEKINEINATIEGIRQAIFKHVPVTATPAEPSTDIQNLILSASKDGVYGYDNASRITPSIEWVTPVQAETYTENIYILDSFANAIWKYIPAGNDYLGPQQYIQDGSDITEAIDIAIDGGIYVLTPSRVDYFMTGKNERFSLRGVYPQFTPSSQITTNQDSERLYISTPEGIAFFNKDGAYQGLFVGEHMNNVSSLYLNESGDTLWLLSQGSWYTITPLQR